MQGLNDRLYAPGQENMVSYWPGDTSDPYAVLDQVDAVNIVEKVKGMEIMTGFETGNKYKIRDKKTGCDLFLAVEESEGLAGAFKKNATKGNNRPWRMKVGMLKGEGQKPERFVNMNRDFQCTICCLNRPFATVRNSKTNQSMGTITEPCVPCRYQLVLADGQGEEYAKVDRCCTAMRCFGCPCNKEVTFPITELGWNGKQIATIKKHATAGGLIGALTGITIDADNFSVTFLPGMTSQQKMQAIGTAIFMDYAYFTKGGLQNDSGAEAVGGALGGETGAAIGALAGFAMGAVAASQQERDPAMQW